MKQIHWNRGALGAARVTILVALWAAGSLLAAPLPPPKRPPEPPTPVYVTIEEAGPDYAVQGEYAGEGWGAQVVALGKGEFAAVLLPGGLPGAGWSGKEKLTLTGKREGDRLPLQGAGTAEIRDGQMTGKTAAGQTFALRRTVRQSPTLGAPPPPGAVVLFADRTPVPATSQQDISDGTLHVEFVTPFRPEARGQARGNSGVIFLKRYEVQVLDSFGLEGKDNECGGIYKIAAPRVNMCFPPLVWQTYDIEFTAPKFDAAGQKVAEACLTVRHNGVLIHDNVAVPRPTLGKIAETPAATGPLTLQGHGNPVFYKNIWFVPEKK